MSVVGVAGAYARSRWPFGQAGLAGATYAVDISKLCGEHDSCQVVLPMAPLAVVLATPAVPILHFGLPLG